MYLLAGIPHLTTLVAPPLSGLLMLIRIWLPFAVAIGALALGLLIIVFMPESLRHLSSSPKSPLLGAADTLTGTDSGEGTITPPEQLPRGIRTYILEKLLPVVTESESQDIFREQIDLFCSRDLSCD